LRFAIDAHDVLIVRDHASLHRCGARFIDDDAFDGEPTFADDVVQLLPTVVCADDPHKDRLPAEGFDVHRDIRGSSQTSLFGGHVDDGDGGLGGDAAHASPDVTIKH